MTNEFRNLVLASITFLFIAGCGGSTGGGDPLPPVTDDLVSITSENATTVAGVVAQQVLEDELFGALTNTSLPIVNAGSGAASALMSLFPAPLPADMAAAQSALEVCDNGGTVDLSISISNPLNISAGDEFGFEFDICDNGSGTILDGGLLITITAFEGDPTSDTFVLGMSMELSAFQVTQDGSVTGASGIISFEINSTPPVTTITVSATALAVTHDGETEHMSSMTVTITTNSETGSVEVDTSFRISSPSLGGDVIVSTSLGLQSSGDGYPFMGELYIQAADNTAIVFIVLDSGMVRLQIDINGDGETDEVVDVTWDELMAAAEAA